jgi:DNA polymerase V
MSQPIAIIDCNNFYASCEQAIDPEARGNPVVVLSNNDGVIIALSNEAKAVGLEKFTPVFKVKHLLDKHNVKIFSANFQLYAYKSQQIMDILRNYSPDVEEYSIDEAFVGLGGFSRFDLTEYATRIRKDILTQTGISTTIGIASTKTLAKIANRIGKKQLDYKVGVVDMYSHNKREQYLKMTDVGDVWGVGRQHKKMLNSNNIYTAYDLAQVPEKWVKKRMSVVGLRTVRELKGFPCIDMKYEHPKKKMIMFSRSFGKKLTRKEDLIEAVALFTARAAERMRGQGSAAKTVSVYLSTSRYAEKRYYEKCEMRLPVPTDATCEILTHTIDAVNRCFAEGILYYKAGVMLSGLQPANNQQMSMLDKRDRFKLERVTQAVDKINQKSGTDTIIYATMGTTNAWKQNQNYKSSNFVESDKLAIELKRSVGFL